MPKGKEVNNKLNKILVSIIIILLLLLSGTGYILRSKMVNLNTANQNILALNDSLRITVNKIGGLESSKKVLITKNNELISLNEDLGTELTKEKGKVYNLTKVVATLGNKTDTFTINSKIKVYPDSTIGLAWNNDTMYDKDNYRLLSGESKFSYDSSGVTNIGTKIYNDKIGFSLITGLREKDNNLEIFVRSDYPGFNVTKLDGAIINPKKNPVFKKFIKPKKWHFGPIIGIGIGTNFTFTPIIGIGGMYSIISL